MSHSVELKEGAFLVGDAHYSVKRPQLLAFLKAIHSKKITPTQLIFMGDIFDVLVGGVELSIEANKEEIALIDDISKDIEVIYIEGNHDFNLKNLFRDAKVFSISKQPLRCSYGDKTIFLAHGDFNIGFSYHIYSLFIRNPFVLYILSVLNSLCFNAILKSLDNYLDKKDDCNSFVGFKNYISKRLVGRYECDYFIEGHYHQNKTIEFKEFNYINLAAFACNQSYFVVKSDKDIELLEEKSF